MYVTRRRRQNYKNACPQRQPPSEAWPLNSDSCVALRHNRLSRAGDGLYLYLHFHALIKAFQNRDEPIDREAVELHPADTREIRRRDAGMFPGLAHADRCAIEHVYDLRGK